MLPHSQQPGCQPKSRRPYQSVGYRLIDSLTDKVLEPQLPPEMLEKRKCHSPSCQQLPLDSTLLAGMKL